MLCLHGKPAVVSTTENGTFWSCGEPSICFVCSEEEKHLYDRAIKAFLATKQDRPRCCGIVSADQVADIERYWTNYLKYRASREQCHQSGITPTNAWAVMYLLLMPNDTTLNSGCTRERSETYGGGPTKRISVAKRISVDLFSRVEKMVRGTFEAVATSSGEIETSLQDHCVTMERSVE